MVLIVRNALNIATYFLQTGASRKGQSVALHLEFSHRALTSEVIAYD
jgi:hypothetical protein